MKKILKIIFIPFVFSLLSCFIYTKLFILLTFLSAFWIVANRKDFSHYENLGVFFIIGVCTVPININIITHYISLNTLLEIHNIMIQIYLLALVILLYIVLFCCEELIVLGIANKILKK